MGALFIPAGQYATDADGSPIPGTYRRIESPLTFGERVEPLILAPLNGIYGLLGPARGLVDTQTVGRPLGPIGALLVILAIGALLSLPVSTRPGDAARRAPLRRACQPPGQPGLAAHRRRHAAFFAARLHDGLLGGDARLLRAVLPAHERRRLRPAGRGRDDHHRRHDRGHGRHG